MQLTEEASQLICRCIEQTIYQLRDHVRSLRQCAISGGNPLVSADAAMEMADDKERDIKEIVALYDKLGDSPVFSVENV